MELTDELCSTQLEQTVQDFGKWTFSLSREEDEKLDTIHVSVKWEVTVH